MTEAIPEPASSPTVAITPAEPGAPRVDSKVYLFLVAGAFLLTGAALFFMALVDALVTELALLLLGLGALAALVSAAAAFSAWRLARLASQAGATRAVLLHSSESRLSLAIYALLVTFVLHTLGCGLTLEFKGYGQDSGSDQDQAAVLRHS